MGQDVLSVGTMGHNYRLYICIYIYIYENQLYIYRQKTETYIDKLFYLGRLLTQKTQHI